MTVYYFKKKGHFSVNVFVGSSDTVDIEMLGYLSDPMPDAYYFVYSFVENNKEL